MVCLFFWGSYFYYLFDSPPLPHSHPTPFLPFLPPSSAVTQMWNAARLSFFHSIALKTTPHTPKLTCWLWQTPIGEAEGLLGMGMAEPTQGCRPGQNGDLGFQSMIHP